MTPGAWPRALVAASALLAFVGPVRAAVGTSTAGAPVALLVVGIVALGVWAATTPAIADVAAAAVAILCLGAVEALGGAADPTGGAGVSGALGLSASFTLPASAALPVAALTAWSVGAVLAWRSPARAAIAWEALVGAVAACFVLAALGKARALGWEWVDPRRVSALLTERAAAGGPLASLRAGIAASHSLSAALAWALVVFEASGVLLLARSARRPLAVLLLVAYGAAAATLGTWSASWAALLLALALRPGNARSSAA